MLRMAERSRNRVTTWFHVRRSDCWSPAESCAEFNDQVIRLFEDCGYSFSAGMPDFRSYICRITCGKYATGNSIIPFPKHAAPAIGTWSFSYENHWNDWIITRALPSYEELWSSIPVRDWEYAGWRHMLWSTLPYCIKRDEKLYLNVVIPYILEDEEGTTDEALPKEEVRAD